jgi:hypothetical protein
MEAMIVGERGARETNVSTIDAFSGIGPNAESFEAVLNDLAARSTGSPSWGGNPSVQDSMAMMGWRDKLPFGRKDGSPSTRDEPLDVRGLARLLKDSKNDSPEVKEAIDKLVRDLLGGQESEFSSLGHVASKVEHAVVGFGRTAGDYVANHAEEIGLSAGAAAGVGLAASTVVDVVGGVAAVAALF